MRGGGAERGVGAGVLGDGADRYIAKPCQVAIDLHGKTKEQLAAIKSSVILELCQVGSAV